eukprot:COSAG02_NODE_6077_length_3816_cov_22.702937_2_plen_48_part_00
MGCFIYQYMSSVFLYRLYVRVPMQDTIYANCTLLVHTPYDFVLQYRS